MNQLRRLAGANSPGQTETDLPFMFGSSVQSATSCLGLLCCAIIRPTIIQVRLSSSHEVQPEVTQDTISIWLTASLNPLSLEPHVRRLWTFISSYTHFGHKIATMLGVSPVSQNRCLVRRTPSVLHTYHGKVRYPTAIVPGAKPFCRNSSDTLSLVFRILTTRDWLPWLRQNTSAHLNAT